MATIIAESGEVFKQVGVMGLRGPKGEIVENQPIYIKISKKEIDPNTGTLPVEEQALDDVAKIFAEKFKQYVDGCRAAGVQPR